jgi:hypothetical protein
VALQALAVTISPTTAEVAPGSAVSLAVDVRNLSAVVDRYRCEILGVNETWVSVSPASIELFPHPSPGDDRAEVAMRPTSGRFLVQVHPPRSPEALARPWTIGVRITSENDATNRLVEEATLLIAPFGAVEASLHPTTLSGRFGASTSLHIANKGNRPEAITVIATDQAGRLDFAIDEPRVTVQPGEAIQVAIRVSEGGLKLAGGRDSRPFAIDVRASSPDARIAPLSGVYDRLALIPSGVPAAVVAVAALALGAMAVNAITNNVPKPTLKPAETTAPTPVPPPTATPTDLPTAPPTAPPTTPPTAPPTSPPTAPPTAPPVVIAEGSLDVLINQALDLETGLLRTLSSEADTGPEDLWLKGNSLVPINSSQIAAKPDEPTPTACGNAKLSTFPMALSTKIGKTITYYCVRTGEADRHIAVVTVTRTGVKIPINNTLIPVWLTSIEYKTWDLTP